MWREEHLYPLFRIKDTDIYWYTNDDMKVSRHFLFIVAILLIIAGGAYYFFTKSSPFEKVSAENLSLLDSYLFKNYSFTLSLDKKTEESIRITCDQGEADLTLAENVTIDYPCQNENPAHKIVIGWAKSSEKYMSIMESLANEQLFWKNHPAILTSTADVLCKERVDYPFIVTYSLEWIVQQMLMKGRYSILLSFSYRQKVLLIKKFL